MRRVWRILVNGLTIVSLLLCLAFAGLWVRSYWRRDFLSWTAPARPGAERPFLNLGSAGGEVMVSAGGYRPYVGPVEVAEGWRAYSYEQTWDPLLIGISNERWGFAYRSNDDPLAHGRVLVVPAWLPLALFAALPLARGALFVRRRRRVRAGHCSNCGYDLRATPDRCPECGAAAAAK